MIPITHTGSANWSPSGEKRQDNDANYSTDPNAIKRFERDFEAYGTAPTISSSSRPGGRCLADVAAGHGHIARVDGRDLRAGKARERIKQRQHPDRLWRLPSALFHRRAVLAPGHAHVSASQPCALGVEPGGALPIRT